MLKYIMGTNQVSGNLTDLKTSQNPILEDRNSYYGKSSKDWIEQMSQENIDLFKIQLSKFDQVVRNFSRPLDRLVDECKIAVSQVS